HTRSDRDWSSDVCSSDLQLRNRASWITKEGNLQSFARLAAGWINGGRSRECADVEPVGEFGAATVQSLADLDNVTAVFGCQQRKIGRASCRERGEVSGGG